MAGKPIPAFYCCYLLRSCVRHGSLYVGSTPNPARRLAQHNGKVTGGAVRTSRLSLRPWEMTCIVSGFPSNIAALQFEWAWHNAHLTRHIAPAERISFATTRSKTSARTGKTTRRPGRPRTSLMDKLSNLHLLLRVPYFSKWPLEVRFFNEEVYRAWQTWVDRVDATIRPSIRILLDLPKLKQDSEEITSAQPPAKCRKTALIGNGGVNGVDPTYARLQDVLEKSQFILDNDEDYNCDICKQQLAAGKDIFTICPHNSCRSLSHVTCLSQNFLLQEKSSELVPGSGKCPRCKTDTQWVELMREVSLRARGEKEIRKLLSKKQRSKAATAAEIMESESEEEAKEATDGLTAADVVYESEDDDDAMSTTSADSHSTIISRSRTAPGAGSPLKKRLEIVIEDSDG